MSLPSRVQELQGNALAVVEGQTSALGETTLIAAPGANRNIYIVMAQLQSEGQTTQLVTLRQGSGAANNIWRVRVISGQMPLNVSVPAGNAFRLGANKALVLNLTVAAEVGYAIAYYVKRG